MPLDVVQTLAYIMGGLCLPIILGMLGILMKHMSNDHEFEMKTVKAQAFLEGELAGLSERTKRLENSQDFPAIRRDIMGA